MIEPRPLETVFRTERLKRHLKELDHEELIEFAEDLLDITSRLTHQTKQLYKIALDNDLLN